MVRPLTRVPLANSFLQMPYVQECVWSPARDVLAVWCREDAVANKPASVRLINPAQPQNTLATKNIFDVSKVGIGRPRS